MSGDYAILAPIYDRTGMSRFTHDLVPRVINHVLSSGWMGRRVLDIGCGNGASLEWLAEHGYILTGIDMSPEMLREARNDSKMAQMNVQWIEQDIREPFRVDNFDMVMCINTLNELGSLRDLETVFQNAHHALKDGKLLVFDLYTIQGLFDQHQAGEQIVYSDEGLFVFGTSSFDYDRQVQSQRYIIFQRNGDVWKHQEATRVMRAYPVQGVASLLQRSGFNVSGALNLNLEKYDPAQNASRVIFMAEKR